jgi:hypothetical protein
MPALVMCGEEKESPGLLRHGSAAVAVALPAARLVERRGLGHAKKLTPTAAILSVIRNPRPGSPAMATATARFSSITGDGARVARAWYSAAICFQSVSSAVRARAWLAAMAACSTYGPGGPPSRSARSRAVKPRLISSWSQRPRFCILGPHVDQGEADNHFLGLGERPVRQGDAAARGGDMRATVQPACRQQHPGLGQFLDKAPHLGVQLLIGRRATAVQRHQEPHRMTSAECL